MTFAVSLSYVILYILLPLAYEIFVETLANQKIYFKALKMYAQLE